MENNNSIKKNEDKMIENWVNVPISYKISREIQTGPTDFYSVSGNYQSTLSPRFQNLDFNANLLNNLPDSKYMAMSKTPLYNYKELYKDFSTPNPYASMNNSPPSDPRTPTVNFENFNNEFSNFVRYESKNRIPPTPVVNNNDDYRQTSNISLMSSQNNPLYDINGPSKSNNNYYNNFKQSYNQNYTPEPKTIIADQLKVVDPNVMQSVMRQNPTIAQSIMNKNKQLSGMQDTNGSAVPPGMSNVYDELQPVIYDRFMYANAKSRLLKDDDFIRGSLPIVPVLPQSDVNSYVLFRPSVTPHLDLRMGYLNQDYGANKELLNLIDSSADGTLFSMAGVPLPRNRDNIRNNVGDVLVTSYY